MPPLNPWLQRLLVAWAASTVTTGAVLATADNRYRPKKAKKKRRRLEGAPARPRPPALPGTVAKADAAEGYTPSLTWGEWFAAVKVRGQRVVRFVTGQPPLGSVDDDGSRLPDEVQTADGHKVRVKTTPPPKKKRRGAAPPQRGRKRQRQATLFESAKESLRQVVKEETQKAVDEKVEEVGLGKARDTLQSAGQKVGKTAAAVAEKVKESIPEDLDEKVQSAGRSLFAGAKRAVQRLGESIGDTLQALEAPPSPPSPPDLVIDMVPGEPMAAAQPDPPPTESEVIDLLATMAALDGAMPPGTPTPPTVAEPAAPSGPTAMTVTTTMAPAVIDDQQSPDAVAGLDVDAIADKVGDGVQAIGSGVQKLGAFLSGPGNPSYQRPGSRVRRAVGDVVEARDPGASPSGSPAASTPVLPPTPTPPDGSDG